MLRNAAAPGAFWALKSRRILSRGKCRRALAAGGVGRVPPGGRGASPGIHQRLHELTPTAFNSHLAQDRNCTRPGVSRLSLGTQWTDRDQTLLKGACTGYCVACRTCLGMQRSAEGEGTSCALHT